MKTAAKSVSHRKFVVARWWLVALTACALVAVLFAAVPAYAQDDDDDDDGGGEFETGEIVVKINPNHVPPATIEEINADYETTTKETFLSSAKIYLLDTNGRLADDLAETMESDPRLLYAEPNYTTDSPEGDLRRYKGRSDYRPVPTSTAAEYSSTQYAITALRLKQAQQVENGAGATVAVLDTGVQADHPELAGSLVPGYDFVDDDADTSDAGNGLDDDGDGETDEMVGHGTHVAGAVHLTAPGTKIMPMRVLDSDGTGNIFLIAEAVQRSVNNGADVINMSLGSSQESDLIADIAEDVAVVPDDDDDDTDDGTDDTPSIENVPPEGVVVVGSAGNNNEEVENYPAAEEGVLAVASVGNGDVRSEFSNFGQWVDISAPGEEIHSLFPTSRYAAWDGTSMAAPFIAGQAALLRGQDPTLPAASGDAAARSVEGAIKTSARNIESKNPNYQGKLGAGHADVAASLGADNAAPTVSAMSPQQGSRTTDRTPRIVATVKDSGSTLAKSNVRLFVNGVNRTTFTYNASTGRLNFSSPRLAYGATNVQIVAKDAQGKQTDRAWKFRVVR